MVRSKLQPPLDQWAKWPVPNYDNPSTQPKHVLIAACVLAPITVSLVFVRLWVRLRQKNTGLDDWLMLASLVFLIPLTVLYPLLMERYYMNRHLWDIEFQYIPVQRKFIIAIYCLNPAASGLIKLSVVLFYRRLARGSVSPLFRYIMHAVFFIVAGSTIAFIVVALCACRPFSAFWEENDFQILAKGGYNYECVNEGATLIANGIVSTATDFIVVILPTILCFNLQLPLRQKLALYGIFAISYAAVAMGVMRTYTTWQIAYTTYDFTWYVGQGFFWSLLELHVGAVCANAPALRAFLRRKTESEYGSSGTSSTPKSFSTQPRSSRASKSPGTPADPSRWSVWKQRNSHTPSGYLREPHTHFGTDKHGGIHHEYKDHVMEARDEYRDMEMGSVSPTVIAGEGEGEDVLLALPKIAAPSSRTLSGGNWLQPSARSSLSPLIRKEQQ